jgi:hypothetical protein
VNQLPLFPGPLAAASRPFARYSRKQDEVRICARCGREIITRRTRNGEVAEYISERGECLSCSRASR